MPGEPLGFGPFPAVIVPRGVSAVRTEGKTSRLAIDDACAGNQTHAARALGMSHASLVNKLARYRVPRPRQR